MKLRATRHRFGDVVLQETPKGLYDVYVDGRPVSYDLTHDEALRLAQRQKSKRIVLVEEDGYRTDLSRSVRI